MPKIIIKNHDEAKEQTLVEEQVEKHVKRKSMSKAKENQKML